MKRLIVVLAMLAAAASTLPSGAAQWDGCSATTGVTASDLVADSAPRCSFDASCPSVAGGFCSYLFQLDVNGTGLVSGTIEVFGLGSSSAVIQSELPGGPSTISCSGAFRCQDFTGNGGNVVLILSNGLFRVTCTGGGLAAVETVGCGILNTN